MWLIMSRSSSAKGTSAVGVAARIAVLLFIFGLAEAAAGSCLSYGHACWGAHGKRSGNTAPTVELTGDESSDGIATQEGARWYLTKLLRQGDPGIKNKIWQRFGSVRSGDVKQYEKEWKANPVDDDVDNVGFSRENEAFSRPLGYQLQGFDESSNRIPFPGKHEFPDEESQNDEVIFMADEQPGRRVPKKIRVLKIMNPERRVEK